MTTQEMIGRMDVVWEEFKAGAADDRELSDARMEIDDWVDRCVAVYDFDDPDDEDDSDVDDSEIDYSPLDYSSDME